MTIGSRGNIVDVTAFEPQPRKDKFKTKANFICARSSLLMLLEDRDMPSRREVKEAWKKLDSCMKIVMTVISNMSDFYERNGDLINGDRAVTARTIGSRGNIANVTAFEPQPRKDKFKTKANFICARSSLLMLLEDRDV